MFSDYKAYKNNSNSWMAPLLNPCFYSVILYRISNIAFRYKLRIIAKLIWFINRVVFSVDIDYRAKIGRNFILVHGIGVVIGCDVRIKDNVKIYQGVTLGGNGKIREIINGQMTQPEIGNNCIIYTNTCVFGPVIINDNSIVKACQVVVKDIG